MDRVIKQVLLRKEEERMGIGPELVKVPITERIARWLAILASLYFVLYLADVLSRLGIDIDLGQHIAIFISIILVLVFLGFSIKGKRRKGEIPWYDVLFLIISLVGPGYIIINYNLLYLTVPIATPLQSALAILTAITILEAMRRTIGWPMAILAVIFFLYGLFASHLPGVLTGPKVRLEQMLSYLYFGSDGMLGSIPKIGATYIITFLLFGTFLNASGAGDFFVKLAFALVGKVRGGAAKVTVIGCALFGTMVGSPAANIAAIGTITMPMMKRSGYSPEMASAVTSVAAVGGNIMPPVMGIVAFVMADYTGLGYAAVAMAAILPAILYFISLFVQTDRESYLTGSKGLPTEAVPPISKSLKEGWYFFIPVVVMAVLLIPFRYPPVIASLYATLSVITVSFFRRSTWFTWKKFTNAMEEGARSAVTVGPILAVLGLVTTGLMVSNILNNLSSTLIALSGGNVVILVIIAGALCYLLGFGVDPIVAYILLSALLVPSMIELGLSSIAANMFIFYMGCSTFITPPNCATVYIAAAVGGARPMPTAWKSIRLGIVCFVVPFIFVFQPALLLIGSPLQILEAVITSIIGVTALACGVEGYLLRKTNWLERVLLMAGGLCLMVPTWMTDVAGIVILATPLLSQWRKRQAVNAT
jgi:TRAP transporter 4TM/12TM fusion protein